MIIMGGDFSFMNASGYF